MPTDPPYTRRGSEPASASMRDVSEFAPTLHRHLIEDIDGLIDQVQ